MVVAGAARAVMGNHEFNAIAWLTPDSAASGEYLRRHSPGNRLQHGDFLSEVDNTPRHAALMNWFLTLPLWLDLGGIRVIHAHWHTPSVAELAPRLGPGQTLTPALLVEGSRRGSAAFRTIESLLRGAAVPRINGSILDSHGMLRDGAPQHAERDCYRARYAGA